MTFEIAFVLVLFGAAVVMMWLERVSPDVVALGLVVALVAGGVLTASEALGGFASDTIFVLACVMVLSRRLADSGIMSRLARRLVEGSEGHGRGTVMRLMAASAGLSTLFSNTSTTAVLQPAAVETAARAGYPPGRLLMPIAFASMLGGSATLIGTSTNLAASGTVARMGLEPFSLFEFLVPGAVVTAAGILFVGLLGGRLIPERKVTEDGSEDMAEFLAAFVLPEGSAAVGGTLADATGDLHGVRVLAVDTARGRRRPDPRRKLAAGDRLILAARSATIMKLAHDPRFAMGGTGGEGGPDPLPEERAGYAAAVALPGLRWIGGTLAAMRRDVGHDPSPVAIHRSGLSAPARPARMRIRTGDVLLLRGSAEGFARVAEEPGFYYRAARDAALPSRREGWYTLAALALALAAGAVGALPLAVALLAAVLALIAAGRFSMEDAYAMIEWRILILIGGMSSFGVAMLESGAGDWLAGALLEIAAPLGTAGVLVGLSVMTVVLTQPMSNAAAALTVLPVAIAMAGQMGVDPRPLAVIVTLSASLSFVTPLEPALLLVYGPGGYRLRDFIRAGLPLTALTVASVVILVPMLWPL